MNRALLAIDQGKLWYLAMATIPFQLHKLSDLILSTGTVWPIRYKASFPFLVCSSGKLGNLLSDCV